MEVTVDFELEDCDCVIEDLLENPFTFRDQFTQKEIVRAGRPTPDLATTAAGSQLRQFKSSWYEENTWVCGCIKKGALYCWPCLLFSTELTEWTTRGITDCNSYHLLKKKHELSPDHVRCCIWLSKFGNNATDDSTDSECPVNPYTHNEKVVSNRYILNCLIDTICFLAFQELPFRKQVENWKSSNAGNYVELLHYRATYDEKLKSHLESSTDFVGSSEEVQSDLIDSIGEVIINRIKEEVKEASFVSLILEQTVGTTNKTHLSFAIRYLNNEDVEERFIKFVDCAHLTSTGLAAHVDSVLSELECDDKFIAQTYDGCTVMVGIHKDLQNLITGKYPSATYVSCYAQKLFLDLKQSLSNIKSCKVFFETLTGFAAFFSKSSKRRAAFEDLLSLRLTNSSHTRWTGTDILVELISEVYTELVAFFESVICSPQDWDGETYICARGFYATLLEFDFNFFLNIFSTVLPQAKSVFITIQSKINDIEQCSVAVEELKRFLRDKRSNFELIWRECEDSFIDSPQRGKRRIVVKPPKEKKSIYFKLYIEIFNTMLDHLNNRFSCVKKLEFLSLLDLNKFQSYSCKFPEAAYDSLVKLYGHCFNAPALKTELSVIYPSLEFQTTNILDLYKYLRDSGVNSALPEVTKLCALYLTLPGVHDSTDRGTSAMKKIQMYVRGAEFREKFTKFSLLGVERKYLKSLTKHPFFHESVINYFSEKNRHINLTFIV